MSKENTIEPLVDVNEAAKLLGISARALRESKYRNESPPYYKLAKNIVRYKESELREWIKTKRVES